MAFDDRLRAALDRTFNEVRAAAHAELDDARRAAELSSRALRASAARISDCICAIDAAPTLGGVLTVVAGSARLEAGRATVMIFRDGKLATYPFRTDAPPEHAAMALTAVRDKAAVIRGAEAAFPIMLGGEVAAVLSASRHSSPDSMTALDLLARHAGRVLEALTFRQITGLSPLSGRPPGTSVEHAP